MFEQFNKLLNQSTIDMDDEMKKTRRLVITN
jgi:hypothetical protein